MDPEQQLRYHQQQKLFELGQKAELGHQYGRLHRQCLQQAGITATALNNSLQYSILQQHHNFIEQQRMQQLSRQHSMSYLQQPERSQQYTQQQNNITTQMACKLELLRQQQLFNRHVQVFAHPPAQRFLSGSNAGSVISPVINNNVQTNQTQSKGKKLIK